MAVGTTVAMLVGTCWGVTNALLQRGVLLAAHKAEHSPPKDAFARWLGHHWASLLTTPGFVLAQGLNWAASAAMVLSLAGSKLHVATPVANAVSIAVTAMTARVLGQEYAHATLLPAGVVCVAIGVALTAS